MGTISMLFVGLTIMIVVAFGLVVLIFVGVGASRLLAAKKSLASINVSDGLDEAEIQIIRDILTKQQTDEQQAAVKVKLAKAAKA